MYRAISSFLPAVHFVRFVLDIVIGKTVLHEKKRGVERLEKDCQNSDIATKRSLLNVVDFNCQISISTPVLDFHISAVLTTTGIILEVLLTIHFALVSKNYFPPPAWWVGLESLLERFLDVRGPNTLGVLVRSFIAARSVRLVLYRL